MLFIGPLSPPPTGPGITNRNLERILRKKFELTVIDTLEHSGASLRSIWLLVKGLLSHDKIIISVSENGRYLLVPVLALLHILYGTKFVVRAPGGKMDREIKHLPVILGFLFKRSLMLSGLILTETKKLKSKLRSLGLKQSFHLGNLRTDRGHRVSIGKSVEKLIFLSKVRPRKGVSNIFDLPDIVNQLCGCSVYLDIYGPVLSSYKEKFYSRVGSKENVTYRGSCKYTEVQEAMSGYDVFIFPTVYEGEGYPGALMEASIVGLPIVSTDFGAADEMICNGVNGLVSSSVNTRALAECVSKLARNPILARSMSANAIEMSGSYKRKKISSTLYGFLDRIQWMEGTSLNSKSS
jgi:glycosyltransferase involved in cell wall biosynthesis